MVNITPQAPEGKQVIEKYGDGNFTISGKKYEGSVIVFPDETITWDADEESLGQSLFNYFYTEENLERVATADVIFLGTGEERQEVDEMLKTAFRENNINVEIMDTSAACHTYNVLMLEGRSVAAFLVAVS